MKAPIAAALAAIALAVSTASAHAHTSVSVQVATPHFGVRIGAPVPVFAPPVYLAPVFVHAPVPVAVPAVPVLVVPPRRFFSAPVFYPVARPFAYAPVVKHRKHRHWDARQAVVPVAGYAYGRQ